MFMKECNFKISDSITLSSAIPEGNVQYITLFFKKTALLLAVQDSHNKQQILCFPRLLHAFIFLASVLN